MSGADIISEEGKSQIVAILNKGIEIEYEFVANCPRVVDHIFHLHSFEDPELQSDLDRLTRDSLNHASMAERTIALLGGQSQMRIAPIDRIVDIRARLEDQLDRERAARALYLEAKDVAERHQLRGITGIVRGLLNNQKDSLARRSNIIEVFDRLATEELAHIELTERIISRLDAKLK